MSTTQYYTVYFAEMFFGWFTKQEFQQLLQMGNHPKIALVEEGLVDIYAWNDKVPCWMQYKSIVLNHTDIDASLPVSCSISYLSKIFKSSQDLTILLPDRKIRLRRTLRQPDGELCRIEDMMNLYTLDMSFIEQHDVQERRYLAQSTKTYLSCIRRQNDIYRAVVQSGSGLNEMFIEIWDYITAIK